MPHQFESHTVEIPKCSSPTEKYRMMCFLRQFTLCTLQHHESDDHAALVADGEMMPRDSELGEMVAQDVVEQQHRFAKAIMGDADALKTDGGAHAAADGFGKCFLGGESLGEQARDVRAGLVFRQLTLAQHARRKTFAVTRPQRFDAGDFDDIGADSKY